MAGLTPPLRVAVRLAADGASSVHAACARFGLPLPRGAAYGPEELAVVDHLDRRLLWQGRVLERWSDRSARWLLVDVVAGHPERATTVYVVRADEAGGACVSNPAPLQAASGADGVHVVRGDDRFVLPARGASLLKGVIIGGAAVVDDPGVELRLRGADGVMRNAETSRVEVECDGPARADVCAEGKFTGDPACPLRFQVRWSFVAGCREVACEVMVRNPRAAKHAGGLWDLGDSGSWHIADLSLRVPPAFDVAVLQWSTQPDAAVREHQPFPLSVYQDSSGGERWNSPNHVGADGELTVSFRGYQVRSGASGAPAVVEEGARAQPRLTARGTTAAVTVTLDDFWQNFPKALRWRKGAAEVGLFPEESRAPVELQGGEQKRHRVRLQFDGAGRAEALAVDALSAWVDPGWIEASGAIAGFVADLGPHVDHEDFVRRAVDGPDSLASRRELIDEYGWRNFGDLYADHEAVRAAAGEPFVSHYNNQYDFVLGAAVHALRTGDRRWQRLMDEAARHTVDIDIYHTDEDRAAFNGGLFWHTDHYVPARTATHRTYSRHNAPGRDYGGGPSNEHNYSSGLLLHYLLTGDRASRDAVIGLADWVVAMDDGGRALLALLDEGPTGAASKTVDESFHGPGRGAANSISTLLDAYRLTRGRAYVAKAEELLRRCIHPRDDLDARRLDDPERRWSYLVFLQVLGKYLDFKQSLGEVDYCFHYARDSLLHYASWMLEHEVPYREVLHKVELPTETWPAHDIRKCHVLHLAASWETTDAAAKYRERAGFFYRRCLDDLATFETRYLTRPMVILCVFGHLHAYYEKQDLALRPGARLQAHDHDFGAPMAFLPQRVRVRRGLHARWGVTIREVGRLFADRLARLRLPRAERP